jgi:formylglycine-generating enzyme required for sulfatase activity
VERLTNGRQRPREEIGLRGRFVLREAAASPTVAAAPQGAAPTPPPAEDPERDLWELAKRRDNASSYEAYLRAFPQGRFAAVARAALQGLQPGSARPVATVSPAPALAPPAAQAPRAGEVFKDCAECPEMVVIPAGRFLMGSPPGEVGRFQDEGPQRWVEVPRFALGKFEVTQGQWLAVMGNNPSALSRCGMNCPVENVSWNDAQEFVRRLSQRTGQNYRLPSEAEWEYAARAGTTTAYFWGDRFDGEHANSSSRSTVAVGRYPANAFGLHDMHGNAWEWIQDVWHGDYTGAPSDGSARMSGGDASRRVLRGGSWFSTPQFLRSAYRFRSTPDNRNDVTGFRIARTF